MAIRSAFIGINKHKDSDIRELTGAKARDGNKLVISSVVASWAQSCSSSAAASDVASD